MIHFIHKNRKYIFGLVLLILLTLSFSSLSAQFGGGAGSKQNPYQISRPEHLNELRDFLGEEYKDVYYLQTRDIDLGVAPWNVGPGWVPIGSPENSFQGNYDGGRYVIKGLTIDRPSSSSQALFGRIENASLSNIGLIDVNIRGYWYVAGIVSMIFHSSVECCFVTGTIEGYNRAGGIAAYMSGDTADNELTAEVTNCYSRATITIRHPRGSYMAGGIVGTIFSGRITHNYSTGLILGAYSSSNSGAVIGFRFPTSAPFVISRNYWNTETTGQIRGGPISWMGVGKTTYELMQQQTYDEFDFNEVWRINEGETYPYLAWEVELYEHNIPLIPPQNLSLTPGNRNVNISWNAPDERVCTPDGYNVYRDGVRINEQPLVNREFSDTDIENFNIYQYQVSALYTNRKSMFTTYLYAAPYLFAGGSGTPEDPYLIETAEQLDGIRYVNDRHFRQIADINLGTAPWNESTGWQPIGSLRGSYDGNGYCISNLTINRPTSNMQGLFGDIQDTVIKNIGLKNVNIVGSYYVGGLSGRIRNVTVERCFVTGKVSGSDYVGGVIGKMGGSSPGGSIRDCYSSTAICLERSDGGIVPSGGGIVGWRARGSVIRNYAVGAVYSPWQSSSGAIIGIGSGGEGEISYNYWNKETSVRNFGGPGVGGGSTTYEMLFPETFEGFDFGDVWRIDDGLSYPYLQWQGNEAEDHNRPFIPPVELKTEVEEGFVILSWLPPDERVIIPDGYYIYQTADTEQYPKRINEQLITETGYRDDSPTFWVNNEYYVTAVYNDNESLRSNISETIPYQFSGGEGTEQNPYFIDNADQLQGIRHFPEFHIRQINDINLEHLSNWQPIGCARNIFKASYDGNGYVISGLTLSANGLHQGLFGYIEDAVLKNIALENVVIINERDNSGALAGTAKKSTIINCYATGRVSGAGDYTGGLIGEIEETLINNCSTIIELISYGRWAGGIVGYCSDNSVIENSYSLGSISLLYKQQQFVGGLFGFLDSSEVLNCFSRVVITASYDADVSRYLVGGLGGKMTGGTIVNSYAAGKIDIDQLNLGGLIGYMTDSEVVNSYWDIEATGFETSFGGEGRTTEKMTYPHDSDTYVDWDFAEVWSVDTDFEVNNGYPYLLNHPVVDVEDEIFNIVHQNRLSNYPNPFNTETTITFSLAEEKDVSLEVFNSRGQMVATLVNRKLSSGNHQVVWNGRDDDNRPLSSGIYLYRIKAGSYNKTNKMILLK